eukprot:gnl/TRDRNA2_/TRDRNA2_192451_c0_seq1.p1 gnl/TRDRNA2_/TRDRNA2_192451_c0~~gnl/TRDRNA2_/TRDRNA2_192451_c0_seq1.p1  ORF type:complete len:150 (-),score=22.33 gnl/TRDRNA2_/TRDRNA2_192451_c0_seq1:237-638(-)
MGAEQCRPCRDDANKDIDLKVAASPDLGVSVLSDSTSTGMTKSSANSGLPPEIVKIQGYWCRDTDGRPMGEIKQSNVEWEEGYQHDPSPLRVAAGGGVEMQLLGTYHRCILEEGPPARLKWSDGEVWVRIREA